MSIANVLENQLPIMVSVTNVKRRVAALDTVTADKVSRCKWINYRKVKGARVSRITIELPN